MNESFVDRLERLGYFRGLTLEKHQALQEEIATSGWRGLFGNSHRFYTADAEDLAEGGIGQFIIKVSPFLSAEGLKIPEIDDDISDDGYVVRVDGLPHSIYGISELQRETSNNEGGLIWGISMVRCFEIVDGLLEKAGSKERIYAVNGGNDLFAFFLTPALFRAIIEHPAASRQNGPYKPTESYPWFGQPH